MHRYKGNYSLSHGGNIFDIVFVGAVILIVLLLCAFIAYDVYGHITQEAILTVYIEEKDHYTTQGEICTMLNNVRNCIPTTVDHWDLRTDTGRVFSTTEDIYNEVSTGRKHVFRVTGWDWSQRIIDLYYLSRLSKTSIAKRTRCNVEFVNSVLAGEVDYDLRVPEHVPHWRKGKRLAI